MPEFQLKIDLGNILTIGILLVTIGISWGSLTSIKDKLSDSLVQVQSLSNKVEKVSDKEIEIDGRLRTVERQLDRQYDQTERAHGKPKN